MEGCRNNDSKGRTRLHFFVPFPWHERGPRTPVAVRGPSDPKYWTESEGYQKFFPDGPAPEGALARKEYAERILNDFTRRAFRRPASARVLSRLVELATTVFESPGRQFEDGIAQAMVATLASPRFLFRIESDAPDGADELYPPIDEWSLASRLSYFLCSTMPDEELLRA